MLTFDRSCRYQFALFLDESLPPREDATEWLPQTMSAPAGETGFGLKLGHAQQEQVLVSQGVGPLLPSTAITWRAGSGVWRLSWTVSSRLDLYFDARGYADITDSEPLDITTIKDRVIRNLALVTESFGQHVNRVALILTVEDSCAAGLTPAQVVARTFFNDQIVASANSNHVLDLLARANQVDSWDLVGLQVPVNRIETGTANVLFRGATPETSLAWQIDVNTSPVIASEHGFKPAEIEEFFKQAAQWCSARIRYLKEFQ